MRAVSDNVLPLATIFIVLAFAIYLAMIILFNRGSASFKCPQGMCATSLSSGKKRCPNDSSSSVLYDPITEVCNSAFSCESPRTPYSVQNDGSASFTGACPTGVTCDCLQQPQCPSYATVAFRPTNTSPYSPYYSQATVYSQLPLPQLLDRSDFCSVTYDWVQRGQVFPANCVKGTMAFVGEGNSVMCVVADKCSNGKIGRYDPSNGTMNCS